MAMPAIGGPGSAFDGLFGVSIAHAGNGNGNGGGNGGGNGHSGEHGGGKGGSHGGALGTGKKLKIYGDTSGHSNKGNHGRGSGFASSFVDGVGKGLGKATSSAKSMVSDLFGNDSSPKGPKTQDATLLPEDVPVPTDNPEKTKNVHAELRSLNSLGRSNEAYVNSQSSLMSDMRAYIMATGDTATGGNQDATAQTDAATTVDPETLLTGIVSKYGAPSAATTETLAIPDATTTPTDGTTAVTTISPEVRSWIDSTLGDPADPDSKISTIRGMLEEQSASDTSTPDLTTTSSTTPSDDLLIQDPPPAE
jgi:hypothetical protein